MIPRIPTTKEEARNQAIEWVSWQSQRSLSYGALAEWQEYFAALGEKFDLTDEFRENGII